MKKSALPILLFLLLSILISSCATVSKKELSLLPFSSDGCSMSPNGLPEKPDAFLKCCIDHDYKYWKGGTEDARSLADEELRQCVTTASNKKIGNIYWTGVRIGGGPAWKTTFHWGYGWKQPRGYQELNAADLQEVDYRTREINWNQIYDSLKSPPAAQ